MFLLVVKWSFIFWQLDERIFHRIILYCIVILFLLLLQMFFILLLWFIRIKSTIIVIHNKCAVHMFNRHKVQMLIMLGSKYSCFRVIIIIIFNVVTLIMLQDVFIIILYWRGCQQSYPFITTESSNCNQSLNMLTQRHIVKILF